MIRHTVLLTFGGVDESLVERVIEELRALPPRIPEILAYAVGRDLGLTEGTATVVVSADFATVDDYRIYSGHPEHVRVLDDHIRPHVTALTRAQVEV